MRLAPYYTDVEIERSQRRIAAILGIPYEGPKDPPDQQKLPFTDPPCDTEQEDDDSDWDEGNEDEPDEDD